jgi:glucose/galactose transporter
MEKNIRIGQAGSLTKREIIISLVITGSLFFIIGFVSWVNSILIPYFKISCELSNFQSYLVAFAFYVSYFFISVPSSYLIRKVGFKKGLMISFWLMAAGAFIFIPAAMTRTYGIFLLGLFVLGAGLAVLQTAVNPYVTLLGPKERAAQRISMMGILNKAAGIVAPLIFAAVVLKSTDNELFRQIPLMGAEEKKVVLDALIKRVIIPYACVGVILSALGLFIRFSVLPEIDTEHEEAAVAIANSGKKSIFEFPHLILGAIAIFMYVGVQIIAIDTIIGYAGSMNIQLLEAKGFPSYTLFATITGYFFMGIICVPRLISQVNVLRICTLLGTVFTLCILFATRQVHLLGHTTDISIWFLVLLGFANSMIWAGIWPLAIEGLGKFTKIGSSILIMGLCGNAILPVIYGHFADKYGLRSAYWILMPCYIYLVYFAFYGYRVKSWAFHKAR